MGKLKNYEVAQRFEVKGDRIVEEQTIPLFDIYAVTGLVELFVQGHIPLEEIKIPNMQPIDGAVYATGDSMEPLIHKGDIILYKTTLSRRGNLLFGRMYLLDIHLDGEEYVTVKYVKESSTPGYYILESENPAYKPTEVPVDSVRAMALVRGTLKLME